MDFFILGCCLAVATGSFRSNPTIQCGGYYDKNANSLIASRGCRRRRARKLGLMAIERGGK
jgi:hypothetical protein